MYEICKNRDINVRDILARLVCYSKIAYNSSLFWNRVIAISVVLIAIELFIIINKDSFPVRNVDVVEIKKHPKSMSDIISDQFDFY